MSAPPSHVVLPADALSRGRAYGLLLALVAPRPIGWITTRSADGVLNLAPFSFFNGVCGDPPTVSVAVARREDGSRKDTARNALASGEFVVHLVERDHLDDVVASSWSYPPDVGEVERLGLETAPGACLATPGLAAPRARMECRLVGHHEVGNGPVDLLLGEVVAFHVAPELLDERGRARVPELEQVGRLGGWWYAPVVERWEVPPPYNAPGAAPDRER